MNIFNNRGVLMTLREMIKQVYYLSVNGNFNHESGWSLSKFKRYLAEKFKDDNRETVIMEIELPDGWWFMEIKRMKINSYHWDCWDYYIPESREDNDRLRNILLNISRGA